MVNQLLSGGECLLSITSFPHLGVNDFLTPTFPSFGPIAQSLFIPDEVINGHPRFRLDGSFVNMAVYVLSTVLIVHV